MFFVSPGLWIFFSIVVAYLLMIGSVAGATGPIDGCYQDERITVNTSQRVKAVFLPESLVANSVFSLLQAEGVEIAKPRIPRELLEKHQRQLISQGKQVEALALEEGRSPTLQLTVGLHGTQRPIKRLGPEVFLVDIAIEAELVTVPSGKVIAKASRQYRKPGRSLNANGSMVIGTMVDKLIPRVLHKGCSVVTKSRAAQSAEGFFVGQKNKVMPEAGASSLDDL